MQGTFKRDNKFEKRQELCQRIRNTYPNRIPVIVEVAQKTQLKLNRKKFLVPEDVSIGALLNEIRKQSSLRPEEAIFIFCGSGVLVPTHSTMSQIYTRYKDEDGFLYITVALENTFGGLHLLELASFNVLDKVLDTGARISKTLGLNKF